MAESHALMNTGDKEKTNKKTSQGRKHRHFDRDVNNPLKSEGQLKEEKKTMHREYSLPLQLTYSRYERLKQTSPILPTLLLLNAPSVTNGITFFQPLKLKFSTKNKLEIKSINNI